LRWTLECPDDEDERDGADECEPDEPLDRGAL